MAQIENEKTIYLGTLRTVALQQHDDGGSIGQYELPVSVSEKMLLGSGDLTGYAKLMISHHLASAIIDTTVPIDYWQFSTAEDIVTKLNLPQYMSFRRR